MAIDRTFESALMKAIRGLEVRQKDLRHPKFESMSDEDLTEALRIPTDERLWAVADAIRRGWSPENIQKISKIDPWFLRKMENLIDVERRLTLLHWHGENDVLLEKTISEAFRIGFPSVTIESLLGISKEFRRTSRLLKAEELDEMGKMKLQCIQLIDRLKVQPVFKMVDTCAGEFASETPYYYGTFEQENDLIAR